MPKMKTLDLFSGIGGFSLGLESTGAFRTVAFCEIEPFCQRVLRYHWPEVPIFGDIHELTKQKLEEVGIESGTIDMVCGGFPCQPFSCAGKRRGKEDDRYLWPEMLRVVKEIRPRWVFGENVANIVSMALDNVLSDLESEGYETAAFVVPACAVGAPHRRDRVWILAYSDGRQYAPCGSQPNKWLLAQSHGREDCALAHAAKRGWCSSTQSKLDGKEGQGESGCGLNDGSKDVAHARGKGLPEPEQKREYAGSIAKCGKRHPQFGLGSLSHGLSSRLARHRWPAPCGCDQYAWEPPRLEVCKTPFRRQKLQALGNAVVPQVVREIGMAILAAERSAFKYNEK